MFFAEKILFQTGFFQKTYYLIENMQPYGVMVAQMILVHLVGVRISVGLPFFYFVICDLYIV